MAFYSPRTQRREALEDDGCGGLYVVVGIIVWVLSFAGFWIYAISEYGFLVGVSLGWLPAAIAATIVAGLWPLIALVVGGIVLWLYLEKG